MLAGDLDAERNPAQVAFGLESIAAGMSPSRMLQGDGDTREWARKSMLAILGVGSP